MTRPSEKKSDSNSIPRAILVRKRWPHPLIWIVPILAAVVALFYFLDRYKEQGAKITVSFQDASGLKADNSHIDRMGVDVGRVTGIELSQDQGRVLVHIQLHRSAGAFANKGSQFWIVRPEINGEKISGLSTITSGPFIEAIPGGGEPASEFDGLENEPNDLGNGLKIVLHAPRMEHVTPDSSVTYRGVKVGVVHSINLSTNANGIDVHLFIWDRYSRLAHLDSRFWVVSGALVNGGILTGVHVKLDSLSSLISGGVEFATPDAAPGDQSGQPAADGAEFPLYDEPKKEWLDWAPRLPLPDGNLRDEPTGIALPQAGEAARSAVKPQ